MRDIFGLAARVFVCVGCAMSAQAVMAQVSGPPMLGAPSGAQLNVPPNVSQTDGDQRAQGYGQSADVPQNTSSAPNPQQYAQQFAEPAQQAEQAQQAQQDQARQECRDVSGNAQIDGKQQQFSGLACRQPDGTWRIEESDDDAGDNGGAAYPAPGVAPDGATEAAAPDAPPYDPYYAYGYPYPYPYPYDPFWGPPFLFGVGASFVFVDRFHHFHHIDHVHFGYPHGFAHGGFHRGFHGGGFHGGGFHGGGFHGGGFHGGGGGFHGR
jgi:surface antigen